jgi:hypothetical protein
MKVGQTPFPMAVLLLSLSSTAVANKPRTVVAKSNLPAAVNGLQMWLSVPSTTAPPSQIPVVMLHLRNVSADEMTVIFDAHVMVLALRNSSGKWEELRDVPNGACAGLCGPLVMRLLPHVERVIALDLSYFWEFPPTRSPDGKGWERGWKTGETCTLQAEFSEFGKLPHENEWQGVIYSNELRIHFPRG